MSPRQSNKYLGAPCVNGHTGWRYVSGKNCVECINIRNDQRRSGAAIVPHEAAVAPTLIIQIEPGLEPFIKPPPRERLMAGR